MPREALNTADLLINSCLITPCDAYPGAVPKLNVVGSIPIARFDSSAMF